MVDQNVERRGRQRDTGREIHRERSVGRENAAGQAADLTGDVLRTQRQTLESVGAEHRAATRRANVVGREIANDRGDTRPWIDLNQLAAATRSPFTAGDTVERTTRCGVERQAGHVTVNAHAVRAHQAVEIFAADRVNRSIATESSGRSAADDSRHDLLRCEIGIDRVGNRIDGRHIGRSIEVEIEFDVDHAITGTGDSCEIRRAIDRGQGQPHAVGLTPLCSSLEAQHADVSRSTTIKEIARTCRWRGPGQLDVSQNSPGLTADEGHAAVAGVRAVQLGAPRQRTGGRRQGTVLAHRVIQPIGRGTGIEARALECERIDVVRIRRLLEGTVVRSQRRHTRTGRRSSRRNVISEWRHERARAGIDRYQSAGGVVVRVRAVVRVDSLVTEHDPVGPHHNVLQSVRRRAAQAEIVRNSGGSVAVERIVRKEPVELIGEQHNVLERQRDHVGGQRVLVRNVDERQRGSRR